MELLIITVGLGLASIGLARAFTKLNFTPCFWYWLGWSLGIAAAEFSAWVGVLPSITPLGHELIIRAHIGAFIGFAFGSYVPGMAMRIRSRSAGKPQKSPIQVSEKVVRVAIFVQFMLSVFLLINRAYQVGGVTGITLLDIRSSYLGDLRGFPRLATHIGLIFYFLPVQFGLEDAHSGSIKMRRLLVLWLAGVPGGLASAGRGWIIGPFSSYAFSYLLAKDGPGSFKQLITLTRKSIPLLSAMVALFVGIAVMRSADFRGDIAREADRPWYQRSLSIIPVITYFGLPVSAAGPYSEIARSQPLSYGALTFPWLSQQLERFKFVKISPYARFVSGSRHEILMSVDWRIASTHATILPNLVGDFGTDGVLLAMVVLMGVFQFLAVHLRNRELFGHTIAVTCASSGGFWLFQDSMFGVGGTVLGLIWTGIFQWWYYRRAA